MIEMTNCILARKYKDNIVCNLNWEVCNPIDCPIYRETDRPIKNIGD